MNDGRNPFACYDRGFMVRVILVAVGMVAIGQSSRLLGLERGSALRIAFAVAQFVLVGYAIGITVGAIRRLDEMQHRVQLEAIAVAFAASAIVMTGWGFLAKAGLPAVEWGAETWLLMVVFWAIGLAIVRRRYR